MIIRLIVWNEGPRYNKFDIKSRGCPVREAALCRAGTAVNAETDSKLAQGLRISDCQCSALSGPSASNPTPAQDSEKMVKDGTERTGEPEDGEECCGLSSAGTHCCCGHLHIIRTRPINIPATLTGLRGLPDKRRDGEQGRGGNVGGGWKERIVVDMINIHCLLHMRLSMNT